jgi:uncharacterized metal-binding protein
MATGEKHAAITQTLALSTVVALAYAMGDVSTAVLAGGGCLAGLLIEPDLDVDGITQSERLLLKNILPLGIVWYILWYPYAWVIPHRSKVSHFPILGTLGRVLHLSLWVFAIAALLGQADALYAWLQTVPLPYWAALAAGLAVADVGHWFADGMPS